MPALNNQQLRTKDDGDATIRQRCVGHARKIQRVAAGQAAERRRGHEKYYLFIQQIILHNSI